MNELHDQRQRLDLLAQLINSQIMLIDIHMDELQTAPDCREKAHRALHQVREIAVLTGRLLATTKNSG